MILLDLFSRHLEKGAELHSVFCDVLGRVEQFLDTKSMKNIFQNQFFIAASLLLLCFFPFSSMGFSSGKESDELVQNKRPNIIIFYVDDLGYGDVGVYGATGVETPNIDLLANEGVRFTDAHCSSATCTPSRYSLLTGNYGFRADANILPGDAPLIIDTASQTLPKVLQSAGYKTGIVGKWHLGLGYGEVDWNEPIGPGPNEVGFDYSFLLPSTGDRVPAVFMENGSVINADPNDPINVSYRNRIDPSPIGIERPDLLKQVADRDHGGTIVNGFSRIGFMTGGESARWVDEDFPFVFTDKSKTFINESKDQPFFLFYSFHDIHVPRAPHDSFKGASEMGPRGDAIVQVDWVVGEIMDQLETLGLTENTLIIFTSDNGPVLDDGYADQSVQLLGAHKPGGVYRGSKYSAHEAGTRVPTIVYWKGEVTPKVSDALVTQVDLLASIAKLTDQEVASEVIDSKNQLDTWLGKTDNGREVIFQEAVTESVRQGNWKYIRPVSFSVPNWLRRKNIDTGLSRTDQLYDLSVDPSERNNLAANQPAKVQEMKTLLLEIENRTERTYEEEEEEVIDEMEVLMTLYNTTGGSNWRRNTNWGSDLPLGDWFGVNTDAEGKISSINLGFNRLTGNIPPELGLLKNLETLRLGENLLTGSIPAEMGGLSNLREVNLTDNQLTGELPSELCELTNLEHLFLASNEFFGSIPAALGQLTNLKEIYLGENQLSGSIPSELGQLSSLEILNLRENQLSGSIPSELSQLVHLIELDLSRNELEQTIPSQLGQMTSLEELSLSKNELIGEIPVELGQMVSLEALNLSSNQLVGEIPVELGQLSELVSLALGSNPLTGQIPVALSQLTKLESLSLYRTQLSGSIPSALSQLENLTGLYLFDNQLTGNIPEELSQLPVLRSLSLRNNQLTGEIPAVLAELPELTFLSLQGNNFTGAIPQAIIDLDIDLTYDPHNAPQ